MDNLKIRPNPLWLTEDSQCTIRAPFDMARVSRLSESTQTLTYFIRSFRRPFTFRHVRGQHRCH